MLQDLLLFTAKVGTKLVSRMLQAVCCKSYVASRIPIFALASDKASIDSLLPQDNHLILHVLLFLSEPSYQFVSQKWTETETVKYRGKLSGGRTTHPEFDLE